MSLIGLLTATEKQVVSGRLHMRPIQWHLKRCWHVPESLEKVIPLPKSIHVHLRWWLDPDKVLKGQPLHPLQHALQLFTDAWGAHLGDYTARGLWSKSEGDLHINLLELKAVLLALRQFERLCWNQTILVCTDNTTVVSYINKEGGYEIRLSLCPPLETPSLAQPEGDCVTSPTHPGSPECHCRQTVPTQTGDSDRMVSPSGDFHLLCRRWHAPAVDLFATRFNHKLPRFVSPVPDRLAWQADALSLRWEDLDAYAFPPTVLLGQVVSKLLDHGCRRLILIAPGWPNMPWFWDLVNMSVQIPLSLRKVKNLLTQPFNQCPHRDLFNLNPHAWLLEPQPFSRQDSLKKWQHELKLLRDAQPELSTSQSGPFLSDGVR